jgi:hypothetical protein
VRPLLPTALLLSTAIHLVAQEDIPLPQKGASSARESALPIIPDNPEPGLPRLGVALAAPAIPGKPVPAPRIRMSPKSGPGESSVHGGQFRVHGKIKEQRDLLLDEAEATRRMVATALRLDEAEATRRVVAPESRTEPSFSFPIVLQIREASALRPGLPTVWSAISQTPDGFRFEVNLVPQNDAVPGPLLRQELVRCILAEILLRRHAAIDMSGRDIPPPDWLLHGVLELLDYQALGRPSEAFSAVFHLGRVLSIDDIFAAEPRDMDSVSRMIYRSSCCGLLLLLMEQENGARHLAELFKILALMPGEDATAIARTYPQLASSGNSLGKWWSLQLATMAQPGMDELLDTHETERELAKALVLEIPPEPAAEEKPSKGGALSKIFGRKKKKDDPAPKTGEAGAAPGAASEYPITEYARILQRKDRAEILARVDLALRKLALRAHPLYRPVVGEYRSLVKALTEGKKEKETAGTLANLASLRRKLQRDMQRVEDYLDWYEATQGEGLSNAFEEYLRTAEDLARPRAPRRDSLSRYLNLIEQEYQPEE